MGKLVDRFGPKRMWSLSAVVQGALFFGWPFIDSFPEYVALAVVMEVAGTLGGTAHGAYVIDVLPPGGARQVAGLHVLRPQRRLQPRRLPRRRRHRLRHRRAALVTRAERGALPGQQCGDPAAARRHARRPRRRAPREAGGHRPRSATAAGSRSPLLTGVLWTNQVMLHTVIPLWLVDRDRRPAGARRGALRHQHASCASCCRRLASRGIQDVDTALRAVRLSDLLLRRYLRLTLATHETVGWVTIVLFFLGHIVLTWCRALPLRLRLDPRGRADGPAPPRRLPRRLRARRHPRPVLGTGRSTASSRWSGAPSAGSPSPASSSRQPRGSTSAAARRSPLPRGQRPGRRPRRRRRAGRDRAAVGRGSRAARPRWSTRTLH